MRVEQLWRDLEERYGLLTGAEVADAAGSRARNRSEYASALARDGKVIAVRRGGQARYPGYQFALGRPVPGLVLVLSVFSEAAWSAESVTLWMAAPNGYLAQQCPADLVSEDPDRVLDAALNASAAV